MNITFKYLGWIFTIIWIATLTVIVYQIVTGTAQGTYICNNPFSGCDAINLNLHKDYR